MYKRQIYGCTETAAFNYDANANTDDGSCIAVVNGCMDSSMSNYNSEANTEDGSCVSWEELANSLQSELDNFVQEDGIGQEDVDAAFASGAASVTPEDGVSQADVDSAYLAGVASVEVPECEEVATQNISLDLPEGWSMFGYTCLESLDVVESFSDISTNKAVCTRPTDKTFKCNVYKNGQLIKNSAVVKREEDYE